MTMEAEDPIIIITVPPGPRTASSIQDLDAIHKGNSSGSINARMFNSKNEAIAYLQSLE